MKIRQKQLSLINPKGAGRKAMHDKGIRHISRDDIKRNTAFHLTIKINRAKAGIKNKTILKILHLAIRGARKMGLAILHYTLEYDHIHLLVEANCKEVMGCGMKSFGVILSKGINKFKAGSGAVYKTRYHLRKLKTPTEIKNVLHYIFNNGKKHKTSNDVVSLFNSFLTIKNYKDFYPGIDVDKVVKKSRQLSELKEVLQTVLDRPKLFIINQLYNCSYQKIILQGSHC